MMRVLFLSAQLPSHLDWGGYLHVAQYAAEQGHRILWASGSALGPLIRQATLDFHPLTETGWRWPPPPPMPPAPPSQARQLEKQLRALDQWLEVERVTAATTEILSIAHDFQPDLIVSEMFVAAAGLVAEKLNIPLVVAGWPAPRAVDPANTQQTTLKDKAASPVSGTALLAEAQLRLAELLTRFDLRGDNWNLAGPPALCSPHLHITFWSPSWYAGIAMGPQTRHAGAMPPAAPLAISTPPIVLITLGTTFNQDANFFINAAHAAIQCGATPLLALGRPLDDPWVQTLLPRLPPLAQSYARLDFPRCLPTIAAAIHHGGAGTTHALARHAIPQLIVPHVADQQRQAQGIMRTGAGAVLLPHVATIAQLAGELAPLLRDDAPARHAAHLLQQELLAQGGPAAAVRWLCALV
jgi:UDP:flavonoid glycosyltransferase YjiC (YdhE family)